MTTEPKDVLKRLASSDADMQFDAVRCLKNEIIGSPNRKQSYVALGAVPRIVRILAYPQQQRLAVQAAAALGSFAYQNTDGVAAIVDSGGVAHLLKALSNADVKLVEASVRSLKMIFQSPISPRDVIFMHPAFERLVEFLDIQEKSFAEDTLIIFAKCCQTKQQQELMLKSGALPKMIKLLFAPVTSTQFAAMEALDRLSYHHWEVCARILEREDVVKTLMRFVRGRNIRMQFAACCLLANLSVYLTTICSANNWFASEVTEVLVNLLEEPSLIAYVPATLALIASKRKDLQQLVFDADGFRRLWKFLTIDGHEQDSTVQIGIVRALGVMCQYLETCRREFFTSRTIWRVLSFMESEAIELRSATSDCFETIVTNTKSNLEKGSFPVTPFSTDPAIHVKEYACTGLALLLSEQQEPDLYSLEVLEYILPFALCPESSIRYKAIWALGNVIRFIAKDKSKKWLPILNELLWNFVRAMVQDTMSAVQEEGLRFLEAMVGTEVGIRAAIDWSNGELLPLIAQKLDTPKYNPLNSPQLVSGEAQMRAVANSEVEHQTAVMGSGVPPRLLACLEEYCPESVKLAAVSCVINLTYRDVLPWGGDDYRSADCRAKALLELGIEESLSKLEKENGSEELTKRVKDAISFLGQLE